MLNVEKLCAWLMKPWIIVAYAALVIFCYFYLDQNIAVYYDQLGMRQNFYWLTLISALGKWQISTGLLLVMALYLTVYHRHSLWHNRIWFLFICLFACNFLALVLKIALGRARPDLWIDSQLYGFYGFQFQRLYWSFPSGHTMTAVSLAAGLSILFPRYSLPFFAVALAVVVSRVLLYQHYLSDVLLSFWLVMLVVGYICKYRRCLSFFQFNKGANA